MDDIEALLNTIRTFYAQLEQLRTIDPRDTCMAYLPRKGCGFPTS